MVNSKYLIKKTTDYHYFEFSLNQTINVITSVEIHRYIKKLYKYFKEYLNKNKEPISNLKRFETIHKYCMNLFKNEKNFEIIKERLSKKSRYYSIFLRKFAKYLYLEGYINEKQKEFIIELCREVERKIKERTINFRKLEDIKNISKEEVIKTLDQLREINNKYFVLSKVLLESGLRGTEIEKLLEIENFDKIKVHEDENFVVLILNYIRKSKKSFYCVIGKGTFNLLLKEKPNTKDFSRFRELIRRKNLLPIKYFRKFNYNVWAIELNNPKLGDIVQGRVSEKNISDYFYLSNLNLIKKNYYDFLKWLENNIYKKLKI